MATSQPSNPSGPQGSGPSQQQAKDQLEALKAVLKLQGDYRDILKDATRDLDKTLKNYDKMEAKLASITRSQINIKEIERQIKSTKEQDYLTTKKIADIEQNLSTGQKNAAKSYLTALEKRHQAEKDLLNAQKTGAIGQIKHYQNMMDAAEKRLKNEEDLLNIDQLAYAQALKSDELNKEVLNKQQQQLKFENDLRKNVGFTGAAFKFMADKIGVGGSYMEDMVEKARKFNEQGKKLTFVDKIKLLGQASLGALAEVFKDPTAFAIAWKAVSSAFDKIGEGAKKAMGAFVDGDGPITKVAGNISGMLKNIPLIGGLLAGVVDSFAMLLDFAVKAKSEIQEMGRQIGLSAQESLDLSNHYHNFAVASGKAYLNNKVLLKTQIDMNKELGITNKISDANVQTAFELMKFAGVELDTVTKIEQLSRITGKSQSSIAGAVMHQVNNFKKLTGVSFSFQGILKEVANLSGYLGLKLAKYPGEIIKSVVAAKGLGLELKQLDSMADGFLDIESSIQKEMEAQVLTGRDINLNRARELFLNNQLVEAGAELSKQLGTSEDFLKMNRVEATSFAEAMGMSRDQVADMLKQQEHLAAFGAGSVKELQKKVALMKEQGRAQEAINKLGSEESFNKLVAASATEDLSGFIEKIKESFAALVSNTKLADMVQNFIQFLSKPDNIAKLLNRIKDVFGTIVSVIGSVMGGIMRAVNVIVGWFSDFQIDEGMISMVEGAGANIKSFDMGNLVSSAPSIGDNAVKAQTAGAGTAAAQPAAQGFGGAQNINNNIVLTMDGRPVASTVQVLNTQSSNIDRNKTINPYPGIYTVG